MWRWTWTLSQSWRLAWIDAGALLDRFPDTAFEEAEQRARDPQNVDERRGRRHWALVARIVAWRSGQDAVARPLQPLRSVRATSARRARAR